MSIYRSTYSIHKMMHLPVGGPGGGCESNELRFTIIPMGSALGMQPTSGKLMYKQAILYVKTLVHILLYGIAIMYNYIIVYRLYKKSVFSVVNFIVLSISVVLTMLVWDNYSEKNIKKIRPIEKTFISVLFSLILIVPGVLLGNSWLSFIVTNSLTVSFEYPFMFLSHAFFFFIRYAYPESDFKNILNIIPGVIALVSLVEYEISAVCKKRKIRVTPLCLSATTVITGIFVFLSLLVVIFNIYDMQSLSIFNN
ncbi:hypothetical protein NEIG_02413 [Nematocida sp. ERTm5]|nr:hypothetical protein NEIG_02413 [Nematocida sp. ERTm5]